MFFLHSLTKQQKNAAPLMTTFSLYHLCKEKKNCLLRMLVFHLSQLRTKEEEQITHGQTSCFTCQTRRTQALKVGHCILSLTQKQIKHKTGHELHTQSPSLEGRTSCTLTQKWIILKTGHKLHTHKIRFTPVRPVRWLKKSAWWKHKTAYNIVSLTLNQNWPHPT